LLALAIVVWIKSQGVLTDDANGDAAAFCPSLCKDWLIRPSLEMEFAPKGQSMLSLHMQVHTVAVTT